MMSRPAKALRQGIAAMRKLYQALLTLLATATDRQLARQVQYLKAENEILRSKLPRRVPVTPKERQRLLKLGKSLGKAIRGLISIVSPRTFLRWLNGDKQQAKAAKPAKPVGRPRTPEEIRDLVLKLARENSWGYTRILGELKKLGVTVCRSTVVNILKAEDLDPGPKRGEGTWDEFLKRHAQTLWSCDFFSKKVFTMRGLVEVFVLFFIQVGTRCVHIAGMTANPDRQWMMQQARNTAMFFAEQADKPRYLLLDNDGKFVPEFDRILEAEGVQVKPITPCSPNLNATAERFVQSVKSEALDHFLIFGEKHLHYILTAYARYYHELRPHQGLGNVPPRATLPAPDTGEPVGEVVCEEFLGGLLKHYSRRAA
jgi:putative transposase